MKKDFLTKATSSLAPVAAMIGTAGAFHQLAADSRHAEFIIALASAALAAAAGLFSVYIARASKSLAGTQRVFISYSRDEKGRARAMRDILERRGAKVWLDENELQPGSDLQSSISSAIENSNKVVAIISEKIGHHLGKELVAAMEKHVPIFALIPDNIQPSEMSSIMRTAKVFRQNGDLEQIAAQVLDTQAAEKADWYSATPI